MSLWGARRVVHRGPADTVVLGLNSFCLDRPILERGVEVREEAVRIAEASDYLARDDARAHIVEKAVNPEPSVGQPAGNRLQTRARIRGTQRMIAAFGARNDEIGPVGAVDERQEVAQQARRDKRHVARDDDHDRRSRRGQRGMKSAERAATRHEVGDVPNAGQRGGGAWPPTSIRSSVICDNSAT